MRTFLAPLKECKEFNEAEKCLSIGNTPVHLTGCIESQKCHLISGLGTNYPFQVIITYNDLKAKEIYEDYRLYNRNVFFLSKQRYYVL